MDSLATVGTTLLTQLATIGVENLGNLSLVIRQRMEATSWKHWPSDIRHASVDWLPMATAIALKETAGEQKLWLQRADFMASSKNSKSRTAVMVARMCGPHATHVINMVLLATAASTASGHWSIEWLESALVSNADKVAEIVGEQLGLNQMLRCRSEYESWNRYIVSGVYAASMQLHEISALERCIELVSTNRGRYRSEMRNFCKFMTGESVVCEISLKNPYLWGVAREFQRQGCPLAGQTGQQVVLTREIARRAIELIEAPATVSEAQYLRERRNARRRVTIVPETAIGFHTMKLIESTPGDIIAVKINVTSLSGAKQLQQEILHCTSIIVKELGNSESINDNVQNLFKAFACDLLLSQYTHAIWAPTGIDMIYDVAYDAMAGTKTDTAQFAYRLVNDGMPYDPDRRCTATTHRGMAWVTGHVYEDPAVQKGWLSYMELDIEHDGQVVEPQKPFRWSHPILDVLRSQRDMFPNPGINTDTTPSGMTASFACVQGRMLHTLLYKGGIVFAAEHMSRAYDYCQETYVAKSRVESKTAITATVLQALTAEGPGAMSVVCADKNTSVRVLLSHLWDHKHPAMAITSGKQYYEICDDTSFAIDDMLKPLRVATGRPTLVSNDGAINIDMDSLSLPTCNAVTPLNIVQEKEMISAYGNWSSILAIAKPYSKHEGYILAAVMSSAMGVIVTLPTIGASEPGCVVGTLMSLIKYPSGHMSTETTTKTPSGKRKNGNVSKLTAEKPINLAEVGLRNNVAQWLRANHTTRSLSGGARGRKKRCMSMLLMPPSFSPLSLEGLSEMVVMQDECSQCGGQAVILSDWLDQPEYKDGYGWTDIEWFD